MKKTIPIFLASLLLVAPVLAQEEVEVEPGMVGAGHPLYGLDVAFDNGMMAIGAADPGDVVHERASEMHQAQERNQTQAMENAYNNLNKVAKRASNQSTKGLQKAERVLEQVRQRAPEQARAGFTKAIENVKNAWNRKPEDLGKKSENVGNKSGNAPTGTGGFDGSGKSPIK